VPAGQNGELHWTTNLSYQVVKALVPQLFS